MNEENPSILPNVATDEDAGFRVRSTQPTTYCRARHAGSDCLQFAGVGDFPLADRAYLRRFKGHYGSGLAIQYRKLSNSERPSYLELGKAGGQSQGTLIPFSSSSQATSVRLAGVKKG